MKYVVVISDNAYRDLEEIKSFISLDNTEKAKEYIKTLFDRFERLEDFPCLGKRISNSMFAYANCLYLPVLNHIAFYQINEKAPIVYILRILSRFQDWHHLIEKDLIGQRSSIVDGERISLIHFDESMLYDVWRNSLDSDNRKYVPDEVFESIEETNEVINHIIKNYTSEDGPFVYAVIRRKDNANLGYVQFLKTKDGFYEIGYHIASTYTNKGYATEAVTLLLDYLKDKTQLKEIYGIVLGTNKKSRRVLEKTGFKVVFEGDGIYQGCKRKIIKTVKAIK